MLKIILKELEEAGDEKIRKKYITYGGKLPMFGVTIGKMSKIIKKYKLKNNYKLSLELYDTNNFDAMYLATLITDSKLITYEKIEQWMKKAYSPMIYTYGIGAVISETNFAQEIIENYIENYDEKYRDTGYCALALYVAYESNENIHIDFIKNVLNKIENNIKIEKVSVRTEMSSTIVAIGQSVFGMYDSALEYADRIGDVETITIGGSLNKSNPKSKLIKIKENNRLNYKRKTSRCY